ncbi:MAG TPA: hypothetical protein VNR18_04355 [Hyphomicrobiales bacterium]|nr:hypothetical protein [Hyphomicrobiales bacterium]
MKTGTKTICYAALAGVALWNATAGAQDGAASQEELEKRIETLENLAVRTQSHVMMDVEYHFSNLWFAAADGQWDLAGFYLKESRSHLAWMVRMRPVRNVPGGGTVDLHPFEDSIGTSFASIEAEIGEQDLEAFKTAYTQTLSQCHACHTASGLGYLEPHVPAHAPSTMMLKDG